MTSFFVILRLKTITTFIGQSESIIDTVASQHLLCHLYKALLYVHDIELVEIGVWWTMSVCFFFPPHQTQAQGNKNGKTKKKQNKKKK